MNAPVPTSPSSTGSSDRAFESSEMCRMNMALAELQSHCRTTQALQSLEAFETNLKKILGIRSPTHTSAVDSTASLDSEDEMRFLRAQKRKQQARSSLQQSQTTKLASTLLTPTKLEPPLPNIWSRLALPKSKTTSNLLSLQSSFTSRLPTPVSRQPKPGEWLSTQHARRTSRSRGTSERKSDVLRDVREFVKTPAKIVHQRMSSTPRTPSYGSNVDKSAGRMLASSKTMPHLRKASTTTPVIRNPPVARLKEFDKLTENLTCAALETGRPPPLAPRVKTPGIVVKMMDGEKVLKSRRRSQRKSSGEIIKGVFDAGVKQVKQMGKRVGGSMSWVGSQEDLSINVLVADGR